ncbi:TOMM precursor leader peptide-binding protein [Lacisediminihabitans sp. FW035]
MVLRLDSRHPLLWRTPQSLQFGLDRPSVVLETVSHADEMVIAALAAGVSRSGAEMIGHSAGLDDHAISALLLRLEPALEHPSSHRSPQSAVVSGTGETAQRVRRLLGDAGVDVLPDLAEAAPDMAVIVAHFVVEPEDHGRWLRRDIPHLPVVYGDRTVSIGPVIRPGAGPCLYCLELHRTGADPSWPAMASQLWSRRSALESSLTAGEVAAEVARRVLARQVVHRVEPLTSIELDPATGQRTLREWSVHPACGCTSLTA